MNSRMMLCVLTLAMAGTMFAGCKKESPEKPAVPEQAKETTPPPAGDVKSGEALFKQHCAVCHPDGGNIVNPQKTLHRETREANGFKTADDIVRNMRNPGPGMTKFDETLLPEQDARAIADYVLKTFK